MQYMYLVGNTIAIDEEYHYKSNNFKYHKYANTTLQRLYLLLKK